MRNNYDYQAVSKAITANSTEKLFGANVAKSCDFQNQDTASDVDVWFGLNPWYLLFDGTNDVVDWGSTVAGVLDNAANGILHVGVLVETAGSGARTILSLSDASAETAFWLKIDTNDKIEASLVVGGTVSWTWTSTNAVELDRWIEISVKHDGVEPTFAVDGDGQLPGSFSVSTDKTDWLSALTTVDTFNLGALDYNSAGDADFFDGGIDYVKVYSGKGTVDSARSLLFYTKLDDGTGNASEEESSETGTVTGAAWTAKQGIRVGEDSARIFHEEDDPGFKDGIWVTNATGSAITVVGKLAPARR